MKSCKLDSSSSSLNRWLSECSFACMCYSSGWASTMVSHWTPKKGPGSSVRNTGKGWRIPCTKFVCMGKQGNNQETSALLPARLRHPFRIAFTVQYLYAARIHGSEGQRGRCERGKPDRRYVDMPGLPLQSGLQRQSGR